MEVEVSLPALEDTEALGAVIGSLLGDAGECVLLIGDLGQGKTSLARGLLRHKLGDPALEVPSPSYLLSLTYASPARPGLQVYHMDPYRLPVGKLAALLPLPQLYKDHVCVIEWPDRIEELPETRLTVTFLGTGAEGQGRKVKLSAQGERWTKVLGDEAQVKRLQQPKASAVDAQAAATATPLAAGDEDGPCIPEPKPRPMETPQKDWLVLGIESSCDDTGAAIVRGDGTVVAEVLASQAGIHEEFGGVKPDEAAKAHARAINETVEQALAKAGVEPGALTAISVTVGPGLALCLSVGVEKAMQLAAAHKTPVVRVHHMEAHAMITRMPLPDKERPEFPFLCLLASGGHSMIVLMEGIGKHTILGATLDDSAGEAFDKTARLLGITKIPGGPHLEKLALEGKPCVDLPLPLARTRDPKLQQGCDFSFAGLKTAVRQLLQGKDVDDSFRANVAASFQDVAVCHLVERTERAIEWAKAKAPIKHLVVAGGVAANKAVRQGLDSLCDAADLTFVCPPLRYCADNGTMVAWTGVERLKLGLWEPAPAVGSAQPTVSHELGAEARPLPAVAVEVRPRWPLGPRDERCVAKRRKGEGLPPAKKPKA